ncbi:hypothetical protein IVA96_27815 [Bradyrhizobium sp. 159]|uniref:hypothetical protein n=1 Tax=unclassified Bradyrhizobium TaxID=2631580 RepID=UPI001FF9214F|nr:MULTISPECIES: hypothetical protein [unclassified Bradyrhizobium]MCK1620319.1 hypothetical protein [Bradyrhizobium sp. 159]MCK1666949.1 hypothetical protein [Bradyrhizobium sp. 153]
MDTMHPDAAQHPGQGCAECRDIVGWTTDEKMPPQFITKNGALQFALPVTHFT